MIITRFNFQRNGADFSVFLNTASEFDGSDSGAKPDEALSWGKIRKEATPVKVKIQKGQQKMILGQITGYLTTECGFQKPLCAMGIHYTIQYMSPKDI